MADEHTKPDTWVVPDVRALAVYWETYPHARGVWVDRNTGLPNHLHKGQEQHHGHPDREEWWPRQAYDYLVECDLPLTEAERQYAADQVAIEEAVASLQQQQPETAMPATVTIMHTDHAVQTRDETHSTSI